MLLYICLTYGHGAYSHAPRDRQPFSAYGQTIFEPPHGSPLLPNENV